MSISDSAYSESRSESRMDSCDTPSSRHAGGAPSCGDSGGRSCVREVGREGAHGAVAWGCKGPLAGARAEAHLAVCVVRRAAWLMRGR